MHHISFNASENRRRSLAALGTIVGEGFVAIDIDEADPRWPNIETWMKTHGVTDTVYNEFSNDEISRARWLKLVGTWNYGYPQPDEENMGFLQATYDLSAGCSKCNLPLKQKAPFQIRGEPKWGRRGIFQLNWVFDEYFVKPEVWASVFKPFGVGCRVVLNRKGQELKTVVQLVSNSPEVDFDTTGLTFEVCDSCGCKRYQPNYRGPFPALLQEPSGAMVRTKQYFGGHIFKGVLVSQELTRKLISENVRGVSFKPVAERKDQTDDQRLA